MKVLIIEDETAFRQVLESQMVKEGIETVGVGLGQEGIRHLEESSFDLVVTDLRLPDIDGIQVIERVREIGHDIPVLLMTAHASLATAVAALQRGAADYLVKPLRVPDLIRRVRQLLEMDRLKKENRLLKQIVQQDAKDYWFPDTPSGQQVKQMLAKVSNTDLTVLITGESGTGKGMTARLIHSLSPRADKPFVPVNCGAIPEQLIESELFGHVKGAFTGADKNKEGLFLAATGGTLFLDEIGELPLAMQVKFLHAIEEKRVRPVGATRDHPIDVRIIVCTNRHLEKMVDDGTFRKDLYYRLNIFQIGLPPLRAQKEVLDSAIELFLARHKHFYKFKDIQIDEEARRLMLAYDWPGNLRELKNVLERALLLSENGRITRRDLPPALTAMDNLTHAVAPVASAGPAEAPSWKEGGTLKERVAAFERQLILKAIEEAGGDRRQAAATLGVGLSTLYRKLEELSE